MFWDNESTNQQTQPSKNSNKVFEVLGDFFGGGFFYKKVFLCLIFAWGLGRFFMGGEFFS